MSHAQPPVMTAPRHAAPAPRVSLRSAVVVIVGFVFVTLAARLFRLADRYAVNIFFSDQWGFHNADLFEKHSLWQMFTWQWGPHRLGLGPLLSKLIEPSFHWNSRIESLAMCSLVTIAAGCALLLKKRLFGVITGWDMAIPIIYLTAAQHESLFMTSDPAHGPLPLLLITLYCLCWTVRKLAIRYALVVVLNFLTIYTGFGLFIGLITPPLLVLDYRANLSTVQRPFYCVSAFVISCASMASFFYNYKLQPAVNCFGLQHQSPIRYFWYVDLMFANLWIKGIDVVPRLIGCLVVLWLVWALVSSIVKMLRSDTNFWTQNAVSATLIGYALLFCISTAIGRICLGLGFAQSSRYTNYVALGVFGAYLHLFTVRPAIFRAILLNVAVIALLATVPIRAEDRGLMRSFSDVKRNWRTCYLSGGSIPDCDSRAGYKIDAEPESVLERKLEFLKQSRNNLYADVGK